jgi:putative ABC transport system permease protein
MGRSRRTQLWLTWAVRDARRRWLLVASIGLMLALGVGMYSAMSSMAGWRRASADASFSTLRAHDLRVSLAPGSYVPAGTLMRAVNGIGSVTSAEERLVVPTQVDASTSGRSIIVPGRMVGAPVDASVDRLAIDRGRGLTQRDDGRAAVVLERNFAKHYDLPAAGRVTLAGSQRARYVGQAEAPEYFIVTAPGADFGAEANFAVLFAPLRTAQALAGQQGRVNELVLRTADVAAVRARLERSLRRALPATGFAITLGSQETARRVLYKDAEGDQQMMDIFAFLLLGAAAFAAFNLISRAIEAQRREIGIGMALGVEPRALALRPLLLGGQIALLGIVLGIPVGLAANSWLRTVMEELMPLPVLRTPLQVGVFARAAALGLAAALVATALPLRRALSVSPVEAIRVGASAARSSGLAWMTRRLRLPGGSLANMPLRNVLRAPRRTVMTVLGIGAIVAITVALAGVIDSFGTTLDASRSEALAGAGQRLTVDLAAPQQRGSRLLRAIDASPAIGATQPSLRLAGSVLRGRHRVDAFVETVAEHGPLWHPTFRHGGLPADRPGVVLAARAADDIGARIGDSVVLRYPLATGPDSVQLASTPLPVTGIHRSPLRFLAYVNEPAARAMRVAGLVNRVSAVPADGRGAGDVKRALLPLPAVTAVQGAAAATDAVDETLAQFTDVLAVTVAIAIVIALLIAYNAAAINAEERTREHATMFAHGIGAGRVVRGSMAEAALIGLLGTGLGIGAGYAILRWIVDVSMSNTMPDLGTLVTVAAPTFALAILAGVVSVSLAPLLTLRRLRRTDIPSALRVIE